MASHYHRRRAQAIRAYPTRGSVHPEPEVFSTNERRFELLKAPQFFRRGIALVRKHRANAGPQVDPRTAIHHHGAATWTAPRRRETKGPTAVAWAQCLFDQRGALFECRRRNRTDY